MIAYLVIFVFKLKSKDVLMPILQSSFRSDLVLTILLWMKVPFVRFSRNTFCRSDPKFESKEISCLRIFDFLWIVRANPTAKVQGIFEWGRAGPISFNLEREDFRRWVRTWYRQQPTYQFIFRNLHLPRVMVVCTISLQHSL